MKQSVFVQQQGVECDFTGSTPWVILSIIVFITIEQPKLIRNIRV